MSIILILCCVYFDTGRQNDATGAQNNWWSSETVLSYLNQTKCFAEDISAALPFVSPITSYLYFQSFSYVKYMTFLVRANLDIVN